MSLLQLLIAGQVVQPVTAIEDVFSAFTYTGNGSTQSIVNGVNLSAKGGMVWAKSRSNALDHGLFDSVNGATEYLKSDSTAALVTQSDTLTSFNTTGFSLGADATFTGVNENTYTYVSWSFAQAAKFFKVAQVVVSGSNVTVDLSSLGTVGMVTVKRTDSTSAWYTWHRSLTSGDLVYLNTTAAQTADASISVSGTTLTLVQATIGNGTYIVYAWAHDDSATGLIQCGSFTTDGSGNASVTLGWEPQFGTVKRSDSSAGGTWSLLDSMRGWIAADSSNYASLFPNLSDAEGTASLIKPNATGFSITGGGFANRTYIYLAIRRGPMKLPTVGTQVYNAIARTGTGAAATVTGVGFPPDLALTGVRTLASNWDMFVDRLRGPSQCLATPLTAAENMATGSSVVSAVSSFNMDGATFAADPFYFSWNYSGNTYINWFFRRYPGVFDEVCYTGTGSATTVAHNLTVVPELMIVKERSAANDWWVYVSSVGNTSYLVFDSTAIPASSATAWNNTTPTSTVLTVGTGAPVNTSAATYVAYLFATLAGISKVGSYTGNGSSLNLPMGFSGNARFFLAKCTSTTGDWFVWDSVRGINGSSANDPHLSLNTIAAEVTTDNSVEPYTTGITVVQNATTNINVTSATYIYLAFA